MATGRVSYKDSEAKVVAENIIPLEKAEEQFARTSHVRVTTAGLGEDTLEELARIVAENEGHCKLFIHCLTPERTEVVVESTVNKGLLPSPAVKERIEALLGKNALWFSLPNSVASSGSSPHP